MFINKLQIVFESTYYPAVAYKPTFPQLGTRSMDVTREYNDALSALGYFNADTSNGLSMFQWVWDNTLMAVPMNLNPIDTPVSVERKPDKLAPPSD